MALDGLVKFFHKLWNPHCPQCWAERDEELERAEHDRVCKSCEILRNQLDIANAEKLRLLDKLTEKPEPIRDTEPIKVTRPRALPWAATRARLEKEDRIKAEKLRREAPRPDTIETDKETEELEKEILLAESERESAGTKHTA